MKTCSPDCRAERHRRIERARYPLIKDTEAWQSVRAHHVEKIRLRLKTDPEFAAIHRAFGRAQTAAWKARIDADPAARLVMLEKKRVQAAAFRGALATDPVAWASHKAKARAWYASLSAEDRERIYPPRSIK
jgi:hypothetical protein